MNPSRFKKAGMRGCNSYQLTGGEWLYVGVTAGEKQIAEKDLEIVEVFIAAHKSSDYFVSELTCEPT